MLERVHFVKAVRMQAVFGGLTPRDRIFSMVITFPHLSCSTDLFFFIVLFIIFISIRIGLIFGSFHPIAFPFDGKDNGMMKQAIQEC